MLMPGTDFPAQAVMMRQWGPCANKGWSSQLPSRVWSITQWYRQDMCVRLSRSWYSTVLALSIANFVCVTSGSIIYSTGRHDLGFRTRFIRNVMSHLKLKRSRLTSCSPSGLT